MRTIMLIAKILIYIVAIAVGIYPIIMFNGMLIGACIDIESWYDIDILFHASIFVALQSIIESYMHLTKILIEKQKPQKPITGKCKILLCCIALLDIVVLGEFFPACRLKEFRGDLADIFFGLPMMCSMPFLAYQIIRFVYLTLRKEKTELADITRNNISINRPEIN